MTCKLRTSISCIIVIICLQNVYSDELANGSSIQWTCQCASDNPGSQGIPLGANCSTSCNCKPDENLGNLNGKRWSCSCGAESVPTGLSSSIQGNGCFTACNCTSGSPGVQQPAAKRLSSKVLVYVLLACVIFTTMAFLASMCFYVYRKDRCPVQPPIFTHDKETSSSSTNLISHRSSSMTEFLDYKDPGLNPILGLLQKVSFMFRSKRGSLPGTIVHFSYHELEQATNKFSDDNLIGLGGSSNVYCGKLKDGKDVAIKRLKKQGGPNSEFEFLTEIEILSRLHHCHIVPLLGYCLISQGKHIERLLVFEYMPNGNLRDCLNATNGNQTMDWETRVNIALGAARGLEYLHEAAAPRILHRDIKSTNILLDDKWRAQITDLGMAKRLMADDMPSCSSSPARMLGTFGYFAPEYAIVGKATLKSDVFSFGVVLLELASGRPPIHKSSSKNDESLVMWATPRLLDSKRVISEIADPALKGNFPKEEMHIMAYLAKECVQFDPESRPSMSEVVQILSSIAPDKSKWRNFPGNIFQGSSCRRIAEDLVQEPASVKQQSCDINDNGTVKFDNTEQWSKRCSLPLMVDRNLCSEGEAQGDTVLSAEYMERLILLTSKARSWRAPEDVDLTEPRLEKFWQPNVRSL